MGWKGTVRTVGAAIRAAERDAKRRQRELEKQQKQYEKMQELQQAAYEVDVYENYIEVIQSIHKEASKTINWRDIASSNKPTEPLKTNNNEKKAKLELDNYKPGLLDRLFRNEEKKKKLLAQNLADAVRKDEKQYKNKISSWKKEVAKWHEDVDIARALLNGDSKTKVQVIENFQPFSEISNLGSSLSVLVKENGLVEATINVHGEDIIPNEVKSLLKTGKLSVKSMPRSRFNEIYQDYVCSSVLRVANELFSIIPDKILIVTAVDDLLDTKTGHLKESPILSVAVSRDTLKSLNLEAIDPSDSMNNFVHNMSFKKTKGFEKVERVEADQLEYA